MSDFLTNRASYFPAAVVHAAQASEHDSGCPAAVSLAQWAIESGYGRYSMGDAHNPFGMKWHAGSKYGKKTLWTKEFYGGAYHSVQADFIAFPSIDQAFIEHGRYLMNPKGWPEYVAAQKVWKDSRDWRRFVELIAPRYATGPKYAAELLGVIDQFHLADFNLPAKA